MRLVRNRRQQARVFAGLLAVVSLIVGCSRGDGSASKAPNCPAGAGRLVAISGSGGTPDKVVAIQLCPYAIKVVVDGGDFSTIAANSTEILVSGNPGTGLVDRLWRIDGDGDGLKPLSAVGDDEAFTPALSDNGLVVYRRGRSVDGRPATVELLDSPDDTSPAVLLQTTDVLGTPDFVAERALVLHLPGASDHPPRDSEVDATISTLWPPADKGSRTVRVKWPTGYRMAADGRVALLRNVSSGKPEGTVVDADGTRHQVPAGWYPVAFEPGGDRLLVARADPAEVGVVFPPRYDAVTVLGSSAAGRVWTGDWVRP